MFLKIIYALCAISGVHSHTQTPMMRNATVPVVTMRNPMAGAIEIDIKEGYTRIRNLCGDFFPYITENTCNETLFNVSNPVDFVSINRANMILRPEAYDLDCYYEDEAHLTYEQAMYNCLPKTYQIRISAFPFPSRKPIKVQMYNITVTSAWPSTGEVLTVGAVLVSTVGTLCICGISSFMAEQKMLCFRKRARGAYALVLEAV